MNNLGQIAGSANYQQSLKAVIWDAGNITVLPSLGGNSQARDINDLGWVRGSSKDTNGIDHLVIWKPVPEPSSLVTLFCGLSGIGTMILRRRR